MSKKLTKEELKKKVKFHEKKLLTIKKKQKNWIKMHEELDLSTNIKISER